jgi:hypothetical protein
MRSVGPVGIPSEQRRQCLSCFASARSLVASVQAQKFVLERDFLNQAYNAGYAKGGIFDSGHSRESVVRKGSGVAHAIRRLKDNGVRIMTLLGSYMIVNRVECRGRLLKHCSLRSGMIREMFRFVADLTGTIIKQPICIVDFVKQESQTNNRLV